ncbi:hypothetical protein [Pseudomonas abyssi]|uniref:hypothetical protein n=1 Tax=Pseudomonas abyssi TaxID=170540 RepID=UPI003C7DDA2D
MTLPVWGCPWHGLWRNQVVELPNGGTRPGSNISGLLSGNTFLQRMPWAPGAERSPEDALADAAAGRQWLDYFLVSGGANGRRVYGQLDFWWRGSGEGWVYAAPNGTAWAVWYSGLVLSASAWDGQLHASQIGAFAPGAVVHSHPLNLADTGQSVPALTSVTDNGVQLPRAVSDQVVDVLPDGSRAIIGVFHDASHGAGSANGLLVIPRGFYLVELSGTPGVDFSASISVLYTRAQTLGTLSDSGALPPFEPYEYSGIGAVSPAIIEDPADGQSCTFVPRTMIANESIDTGGWAVPHFVYTLYPGNEQRTIEVVDQIIACWFDPVTGAPVPVYADTRLHWRDERSELEQTGSGSLSGTWTGSAVDGGGSISWALGYSETIEKEFRITLRAGGQSITSYINETYQHDYTGSWTGAFWTPIGQDVVGVSQALATETSTVTRTVSTPDGSNTETIPLAVFGLGRQDWRYPDPIGATRQMYLIEPYAFFAVSPYGNDSAHEVGVLRYSNNLLATLRRETDVGQFDTWIQGTCLTPAGAVTGSITTPKTDRYGTWHPVTHDIERGRDEAVCWV